MTPRVEEDLCIGCELCADICPNVFEMGSDGLSHVIDDDPAEAEHDCVQEAADVCPTDAIILEE